MSRTSAVSAFLAGDPATLGPEVSSLEKLLHAAGLTPGAAAMMLMPGVMLVRSLTADTVTALRWFRLPHAPVLLSGRVETVVVLTTALRDIGRALHLVGRVRACLGVPGLMARLATATTREALVQALSAVENRAGESPLQSTELLLLLGSAAEGLSAGAAARRLTACGANRIERLRRHPMAARLLEQLTSFFAVLLWIGGGLALLAGLPELGWAIFVVILVNGVFSFWQEHRAERAVEALQELFPHTIGVIRDGREVRVPTATIVPGDVVRVEEGDQIPADGQLLSAAGLRVDQSALTGEPHSVFKLATELDQRENVPLEERHELLFAGTGVVAGSGLFVVRATGMATAIGGIAQLTQAVIEEPSPLQREMGRVTRVVTLLSLSVGAGFLALGAASGALPLGQGFFFALGVIVANVPEGLLPTLSLALALGAQRLARHRCLVKRLSSVETLGATTVICTDKTGTLTQNRMAVRNVWVDGRTVALRELDLAAVPGAHELLSAAVLACQATADRGDPTERAIVAAGAARLDVDRLRAAHALLAPYPFDSFRKRMTLVRADGPGARAFVKGAPKPILALCSRVREGGRDIELTDERRATIIADHDRLAAEGLRILAIAVRSVSAEELGAPAAMIERELTFLGLVALWDPPRPEVEPAVALCRRAGIRVVMITGDDGLTAGAIARQVGLDVTKVVTGDELERIPSGVLGELLADGGVLFARTSPAHKLRIVSALRALGETVAVTGDGVNDAPALKAADIGVAMGLRGSDVAKEAAVMVITDDNFASIVSGIRAGRAIYANIGKFVTYIFASNVPELVPFLVFVFLDVPLPLTVMQILAVDLGTDLLPALSLGAERAEPGLMDRPPRSPKARLLAMPRLLHAYAFLGIAEAALALAAFFWTYLVAGWRPGLPMAATGPLYRRATTMTLAGIVAAQVGNIFACRTERESLWRVGFLSNRMILASVLGEIGILAILILVPPFPSIFGLESLRFAEWRILLAFPLVMLLLEEGRKCAVRRWIRSREGEGRRHPSKG